jgi:hypothetical protein
MTAQSFKTIILAGETKNVTGIEVPPSVIESFGAGQRPRLKVEINGYGFVSTVGKMGGRFMISLSAAHRSGAGLSGGDTVQVTLDLAPEPETLVVPQDLVSAITSAGLADRFEAAAPSRRKEWVRGVEEAKAPETRARRVQKVVEALGG